ncbi:hypothetical protein [Yoonia sp. 2307UL14-13]|uniref:hypothetical protein n=1 Tax=Yoonia sp. 2307UL14-13 TaxID=3126506 RepID=UPI0030AA218F
MFYSFSYTWGQYATQLNGEIRRPHPTHGLQLNHLIGLVDAVTTWKRPQHLAFGSVSYLVHFHPLARNRVGIRWIGWLPFDLSPSDVPEAEIVRPMNGGTLVITQSDFWQPMQGHPNYSKEAIDRAQEVEVRLNLLGVLPIDLELNRGDWGVRGTR